MTDRGAGGRVTYTQMVTVLKVALPSLAVVLLTLVVLWPQLSGGPDKVSPLSYATLSAPQSQTQRMVNARFHSTDGSNQPFTVTAEVAEETAPGSQMISLTRPRADITLTSGAWLLLEAGQGLFHQRDNRLDLTEGVNLFQDGGYELHTTHLAVDLAQGSAVGTDPVQGQGPMGEIQGQGLRIVDRGQVVTFTGKSRLLLKPDSQSPLAKPAQNRQK